MQKNIKNNSKHEQLTKNNGTKIIWLCFPCSKAKSKGDNQVEVNGHQWTNAPGRLTDCFPLNIDSACLPQCRGQWTKENNRNTTTYNIGYIATTITSSTISTTFIITINSTRRKKKNKKKK